MQARLRISPAAVFAVSFLVLLVSTAPVGARIVIDNDVSIDWLQQDKIVSASVAGAPRLVRDWNNVTVTVRFLSGALDTRKTSELHLSIYPLDLCSTATACPTSATLSFNSIPPAGFGLGDFMTAAGKPINNTTVGAPGILVVGGRLHADTFGTPMALITVAGDGDPIVIDRSGDDDHFHPGDVADVPARSIELMRALDQIETSLFSSRAVELDAVRPSGADIAVGWTHMFLPRFGFRPVTLKTATLTFRLLSGDPCASKDVILLDRAVRIAAADRRPRLPLTFLSDLQEVAPNQGCPAADRPGGEHEFHIDLKRVPIRFLSPDDPIPSPPVWRDLTADLDDGRLNVIVAGRSFVDFSDLTVTFHDRE